MSNQGPSTISCTVDHPKDWPCAICTPTPSDSAMTAERLAQRLDKWSHFASFGDAYQAEAREIAAFVRALSAERTKLAADLARVTSERDGITDRIMELITNAYDQGYREATNAAEAKSARLVEALNRFLYATHFVSADSWDFCPECRDRIRWAAESIEQLTDNEAAAVAQLYHRDRALTLPEPSHEP